MKKIDEQIKQELFFEKYKYASFSEFDNAIKLLFADLIKQINYNVKDLNTEIRIRKFLKDFYEEIDLIYKNAQENGLIEIALANKAFQKTEEKLLETKLNFKMLDQIYNEKNDIIIGYTFAELFASSNTSLKAKIKQDLTYNLVQNKNIDRYKKDIFDNQITLSQKQIRTNIRTYQKLLRERIRDENEKVLNSTDSFLGWKSIGTLDSKTTPICIALDNEFYSKDKYKSRNDIENRPPRHFNCRSILIRVFKDNEAIARAAKGDKGGQQVSSSLTFNSFLERNPKTAEKILGTKRYELFKTGKYNIKDFIDTNNNVFFSAQEIEEMF